jgi:hypothetical protein
MNNPGAGANVALGLPGLAWPNAAARFTSIESQGLTGLSEIRATYGGVFPALGGYALWSQNRIVFTAVGVAWLGAVVVDPG